jgi:hypothetical protein
LPNVHRDWLSLLALMLVGGFDSVSVILRGTIQQLSTQIRYLESTYRIFYAKKEYNSNIG